MSELPALASSGRTSIPNDREVPKSLYRAAGYRVAGTRAVRVDILERLADLIRPAIGWKPGNPGEKPAGAIDGFGFTVSVAMTSLVGCAGEDFASILKALGYRMDRRPAPVETKPEAAPQESAADEAATEEAASQEAAQETDTAGAEPVAEATPAAPALSAPDPVMPDAPALAAGAQIPAVTEVTPPAPDAVAAEVPMIEVWRPGRPREQRRPEHRRPPRKSAAKAEAAADAPANERPRHERREKHGKHRGPRKDAAPFKPRPERKEKPLDPNSPFASLLALKEKLEGAKKDKG